MRASLGRTFGTLSKMVRRQPIQTPINQSKGFNIFITLLSKCLYTHAMGPLARTDGVVLEGRVAREVRQATAVRSDDIG